MFELRFGRIALLIMIMLSILLVRCEDEKAADQTEKVEEEMVEKEEENAVQEPTAGGTITGAMFSAPAGMFNPIFYDDAYEGNILSFTHESLVSQNEKLEYIPKLAEDWETSEDQTELTLYLEKGIKWHDGEEFTADDVVFTYQSIAHPDYIEAGGIRTAYVKALLGYKDYANGESDEFQGVTAVDDYTVTFTFSEPTINPLYFASLSIIPEHIFKEIPVAEMPKAAESREPGKVIGTGPFKFTEMIEGETYTLERYDNYWQGKPYLDKVIWQVTAKPVITGLLESGEIDFIADPDGVSPVNYDLLNELEQINIIEQADFGYQILGFIHHHVTEEDIENGVINPDNWVVNEKIATPEVRQAIAYAVDREKLIQELLDGHGEILNSPIAKQFWAYDESESTTYSYNQEKSMTILDELGYVDTNDDGFRENPDGNEWTLNLNYPSGNEIREQTAPLIKQMLEDVGIQVNLREPKELYPFIQELTNETNDWDLFLLGWNLPSSDPDPSSLWSTNAAYNFSRWNNAESEELLMKALQAPEAIEQDYRKEIYRDWQKLYSEDLPAFMLYAQNSLWAYNTRLQGVEPLPFTMYNNVHQWWVTDTE
ncbi:ABC transporter substrate-binding protein [Ornithinibacillus californiensis]|uniref:ABC transporter substrate-binding protein n=1 Tax=Ornithinibacillus californiensis TaxID=161536 RepID=UPI000A052A12|nr:ABC transporter substrate-binding protein [Ornithinibacillus californiensis]